VRAAIALLSASFALAGWGIAAASTHATLSLLQRQPIVLRGRGFHQLERVRLVLETRVRRVKQVRAGRGGSFTAAFVGVSVPHCGGIFVHARGAAGSLATLKIPLPACQVD
jgi:hypothetical protein